MFIAVENGLTHKARHHTEGGDEILVHTGQQHTLSVSQSLLGAGGVACTQKVMEVVLLRMEK